MTRREAARRSEAKAAAAVEVETVRKGNLMRLGCVNLPGTASCHLLSLHDERRLLMAVTMTLHNLPEGFAVRELDACMLRYCLLSEMRRGPVVGRLRFRRSPTSAFTWLWLWRFTTSPRD